MADVYARVNSAKGIEFVPIGGGQFLLMMGLVGNIPSDNSTSNESIQVVGGPMSSLWVGELISAARTYYTSIGHTLKIIMLPDGTVSEF